MEAFSDTKFVPYISHPCHRKYTNPTVASLKTWRVAQVLTIKEIQLYPFTIRG